MRVLDAALRAWKLLAVLSALSSTYLYLYPLFKGCNFHVSREEGQVAPFRLLALADPQLEGDSSLPGAMRSGSTNKMPSLKRLEDLVLRRGSPSSASWADELRTIAKELAYTDVPMLLERYRKRLDLLGNDRYLAHIYRTIKWWTKPTHVVVLGDLLGSQWVNDDEFDKRSRRFWETVFKGASMVPDQIYDYEDIAHEHSVKWDEALITVAGNHDIGYAGEMAENMVERFEKHFGRLNWHIDFGLENGKLRMLTRNQAAFAESPRLKLMVLNDMNLDSPAYSKKLQADTKRFLTEHVGKAMGQTYLDATILLTHIPLYKKEGLCVDSPFFQHYGEENGGGGIREQNQLTQSTSQEILDGLFLYEGTWARSGLILNGHDHEGCNIVHSRHLRNSIAEANTSTIGDWTSLPIDLIHEAGVSRDESTREVTVRSMMGAYGGNAGLLSGWFDKKERRWRFEYSSCEAGVQHLWWAVHILNLVTVLVGLAVLPLSLVQSEPRIDSVSYRSKKDQ